MWLGLQDLVIDLLGAGCPDIVVFGCTILLFIVLIFIIIFPFKILSDIWG